MARINISVGESLNKKLNHISDEFNLSKSGFVRYAVSKELKQFYTNGGIAMKKKGKELDVEMSKCRCERKKNGSVRFDCPPESVKEVGEDEQTDKEEVN